MKRSIIIIEPSVIVSSGLTDILNDSHEFSVVACETDAENLDAVIIAQKPQILLINPMLNINVTQVKAEHDLPVAAILYQQLPPSELKKFDLVINIFDSRHSIVSSISNAIENREKGSRQRQADYELSKREISVLVLVAKGLRNKEIADRLNVSEHTIMTHRKNIMQKTGIKSVAGLTVYAMLNGLIDEDSLDDVFHSQ